MILVLGANGNMGKRYQAILSYLGRQHTGLDAGFSERQLEYRAQKSDGIIIATPTDTHADLIRQCLRFRKPILCEKPIMKDVEKLRELLNEIRKSGTPFRMVYQYKMLINPNSIGKSLYNYFKHGNDGLYWDCLQIIGLARGQISIRENSPIWSCMINGKALHQNHMDAAYIGYIQYWLKNPSQDLEEIFEAHEKTARLEKEALSAEL